MHERVCSEILVVGGGGGPRGDVRAGRVFAQTQRGERRGGGVASARVRARRRGTAHLRGFLRDGERVRLERRGRRQDVDGVVVDRHPADGEDTNRRRRSRVAHDGDTATAPIAADERGEIAARARRGGAPRGEGEGDCPQVFCR